MSLKAKSKAYCYRSKYLIYVPKEMCLDSQFPLPQRATSEVVITIRGKRLVVEGAK